MMKKALYVDIDGTLARFHDADKMFIEMMWTPGFYRELRPFENLVEAVKLFMERNPDVEIYVLSAVLETDPPFIEGEKNEWLDAFLPEINRDHRIFTRAGDDKSQYLQMEGRECFLLDDYNKNLYEFEAAGGVGIKFHNDVNHRGLGEYGGSKGNLWGGAIVHYYNNAETMFIDLEDIVMGKYLDGRGQEERFADVVPERDAEVVDMVIAKAVARAKANEDLEGAEFYSVEVI